jgi:hypothetical protein
MKSSKSVGIFRYPLELQRNQKPSEVHRLSKMTAEGTVHRTKLACEQNYAAITVWQEHQHIRLFDSPVSPCGSTHVSRLLASRRKRLDGHRDDMAKSASASASSSSPPKDDADWGFVLGRAEREASVGCRPLEAD